MVKKKQQFGTVVAVIFGFVKLLATNSGWATLLGILGIQVFGVWMISTDNKFDFPDDSIGLLSLSLFIVIIKILYSWGFAPWFFKIG